MPSAASRSPALPRRDDLVEHHPTFAEHERLLAKLGKVLGRPPTFADILEASAEELALPSALGVRGAAQLAKLQAVVRERFPALAMGPAATTDSPCYLNAALLDPLEDKALRTLASRLGTELAVADVMRLDARKVTELDRVGKVTARGLLQVQRSILAALVAGIPDDAAARTLVVPTRLRPLTWPEIDRALADDVQAWFSALDEREQAIARDRWGVCAPKRRADHRLTLDELSACFAVTRERVRQQEEAMVHRLPRCLRIHPSVLIGYVRGVELSRLEEQLPRTRALCSDRESFGELIERAVDLARAGLFVEEPPVELPDLDALDAFFADHAGTLDRAQCRAELERQAPGLGERADAWIGAALEEGVLRELDGRLSPGNLTAGQAVAHVLAGAPEGMPWRDVVEEADRRGLTRRPVTATGLHAFGRSDRVYLVGPGTYRHTRFSGLDDATTVAAVVGLHAALMAGTKAATLRAAQARMSIPIGYWELRLAVSRHADAAGIEFDGTAGRDRVWIRAAFAGKPETFESEAEERPPRADAPARVRTPTPPRAVLRPVAAGRGPTARPAVSRPTMRTPEPPPPPVRAPTGPVIRRRRVETTALDEGTTAMVLDAIDQLVSKSARATELDAIREHVARHADLTLASVAALVTTHAHELGWHTAGTLVSRRPIPWTDLGEAVEAAAAGKKRRDVVEIVARTRRLVRISNATAEALRNALHVRGR
jgi:hypothetical protein